MKKSSKKKVIFYPIYRFLLSIIAVFILVNLLYPLVHKNTSVPYANTISRTESLKLKVENNAVGTFCNKKVNVPNILYSPNESKSSVLGTASGSGEKHIYVNLATQTLTAYQGKTLFMQTLISSGRWGRTPKGEFTIWVKLRSTRMSGGSGADYYDLPNVPYVMFFSNNEIPGSAGFSMHGTYWHNNFGHTMSHGCVNMRTTDVAKLYNWADPQTNGYTTYADSKNQGTKVTIFGDPPS